MTAHPTSSWVIQQLREAFPEEPAPRFLIYDNDSIFSERVTESINNIGIEPQRTVVRSPWQNGIAERWVGSARREKLDHVIVISEEYLRRLLREYVAYYNTDRVHTRLRDSPAGRPTENRPSSDAKIVGFPRVGGRILRTDKLSARAGTALEKLRRLELGVVVGMKIETLMRIAGALGVAPEDLLPELGNVTTPEAVPSKRRTVDPGLRIWPRPSRIGATSRRA